MDFSVITQLSDYRDTDTLTSWKLIHILQSSRIRILGTLSIDNEMARRRRAEVKIFPREGSAHVRCCENVV